ncbi:MAG: AAA family ATPase [Gammaproteobacteria bacterium]|nr:AAA family ATPase [Gammaproteobacteria bacterium]
MQESRLAATGVAGLDDILGGGLSVNHLYLLEGVPGSGKTTLALQFLEAGAARGETVLYITLSETELELRQVAESHGWSLRGVHLVELVASEATLDGDNYTMFHPSEVELGATTQRILADVDRLTPSRIVIDSLSELRLLAGSPLRFRRQILALKQYFVGRECTVLLLDDLTSTDQDLQVQSIAHGVIRLEQLYPEYGSERRRLMVLKYRGRGFRGGYHDYVVRRGGLDVFPRLVAAEHRQVPSAEKMCSGVPELDQLLGGGIERGTSSLFVGAPGTGKSSLTVQFAHAAAARGQRTALFLFDELPATLLSRAAGLGLDIAPFVADGSVILQQVDPGELSPGALIHAVRTMVTERNVVLIVLDSLNGYLHAMPGERYLLVQLHELLAYLGQQGVATILVGAQSGIIGGHMTSPVDVSYLADAILLLRYFEADGEVRQAISVIKKRGGIHERSIREFRLTAAGIHVSPPLRQFRGILTGVPERQEVAPD